MTVYARSDVSYVGISPDHGGCGEGHSRPVVGGAPAKVWALTCHGGCEDHLRSDPLWSATPQTVPETPDETLARLDLEKRGEHDRAESTSEALQKLAAMPDVLAQFMKFMSTGAQPAAAAEPAQPLPRPETADLTTCESGHPNPAVAKFCVECGVPMFDDEPPVVDELDPPAPVPSDPEPPDPMSMNMAQLRSACKDAGLPATGAKTELVHRLQEHYAKQ